VYTILTESSGKKQGDLIILFFSKRAEQIKASRAKKTPDRKGPKQTEELSELKQFRRDGRQTELEGDTGKSDTGRQLGSEVIPNQKTKLWFMCCKSVE
jgi:hypothetical protein